MLADYSDGEELVEVSSNDTEAAMAMHGGDSVARNWLKFSLTGRNTMKVYHGSTVGLPPSLLLLDTACVICITCMHAR